ncbi:MAG: hypothetical protein EOM26_11780 [Alphaproteobacteria bacterium]|nr:hypothetical protein [Alphaproteobacteria bacterium]
MSQRLSKMFGDLAANGVPMPMMATMIAPWVPESMEDWMISTALPDSVDPLIKDIGMEKALGLAMPLIGSGAGGSGGAQSDKGITQALGELSTEERAAFAKVLTTVPPEKMEAILADIPEGTRTPPVLQLAGKGTELAQAAGLDTQQIASFTSGLGKLREAAASSEPEAGADNAARTDSRIEINNTLGQLRETVLPLSKKLHSQDYTDEHRTAVANWLASDNFPQAMTDLNETKGFLGGIWNKGTTLDGGMDIAATAGGGLLGGMLGSKILGGIMGMFGEGGAGIGKFLGFLLGAVAGALGGGALFGNKAQAAEPPANENDSPEADSQEAGKPAADGKEPAAESSQPGAGSESPNPAEVAEVPSAADEMDARDAEQAAAEAKAPVPPTPARLTEPGGLSEDANPALAGTPTTNAPTEPALDPNAPRVADAGTLPPTPANGGDGGFGARPSF